MPRGGSMKSKGSSLGCFLLRADSLCGLGASGMRLLCFSQGSLVVNFFLLGLGLLFHEASQPKVYVSCLSHASSSRVILKAIAIYVTLLPCISFSVTWTQNSMKKQCGTMKKCIRRRKQKVKVFGSMLLRKRCGLTCRP